MPNNSKVQKGNPHQLPVYLHTFPTKSIQRYANSNGLVQVYQKTLDSKILLKPNNRRFTVKRIWDAKAEYHFKQIEDRYQDMIDRVDVTSDPKYTLLDNDTITEMYVSWHIRSTTEQFEDLKLEGIEEPSPLVEDTTDHELIESNHMISVRNGNIIAGHQAAWPIMLRRMNELQNYLSKQRWGLLKSNVGDFICPDTFRRYPILPVSPTLIFYNNAGHQEIGMQTLKQHNDSARKHSKEYYFSRNINKCP